MRRMKKRASESGRRVGRVFRTGDGEGVEEGDEKSDSFVNVRQILFARSRALSFTNFDEGERMPFI